MPALKATALAGLLSWSLAPALAQVPGSPMGPPPDSRYAPGTSGPNLACRFFSVSCPKEPEPAPAAAPEAQIDAPPPATKHAHRSQTGRTKSKAKTADPE